MTLFFPSRTPSCSLIFPLALFSNIETENLPVSVQEILGKKLRGIRYPHFPVGFTLRQKHNLQSKSSQIISGEGKKHQLILILSFIQSRSLGVGFQSKCLVLFVSSSPEIPCNLREKSNKKNLPYMAPSENHLLSTLLQGRE